ncbi:TPA: hypothetical protein KQG29_001562 [Clostridioides difficile]|nr:hypothetical protein [Clostridioides difficile]
MSETREKDNEITISITSTYQKDSKTWEELINPLRKKRELAPFTKTLLSLYAEDEEFRNLADKKIKENSLPERVKNRINQITENHEKAMCQAKLLSDVIVSKSISINSSTVNISENNPFDTDGLLESLSRLLPSDVRKNIENTIEKTFNDRIKRLEKLYSNNRNINNTVQEKDNNASFDDSNIILEEDNNSSLDDSNIILEEGNNSSLDDSNIILEEGNNSSLDDSNIILEEDNNSSLDDSNIILEEDDNTTQGHNIILEYNDSSKENGDEEEIEIFDDGDEDDTNREEKKTELPAQSLLNLISSVKK